MVRKQTKRAKKADGRRKKVAEATQPHAPSESPHADATVSPPETKAETAGEEATTTEVTPTTVLLPGETELDGDLIDKAVEHLNHLHVAKGLDMARALGEYVVETFFDGDLDAFRERGGKHVTFRALAKRDDLTVAYTTVWYSVSVLAQLRELPENLAGALPLTHHKALLPLKDPNAKIRFATMAVEKGMSSRELGAVVRSELKETRKGAPRGRRPLPAFMRGLTRLRKALELTLSEAVDDATLERYEPTKAQELATDLDAQIARLTEIRAKLRGVAERGGEGGGAPA